jgi:hypothetical protein
VLGEEVGIPLIELELVEDHHEATEVDKRPIRVPLGELFEVLVELFRIGLE